METKIQLKHPAGKKAVSMDKGKYETLKKALLSLLRAKGETSHTEIIKTITRDFKNNKIKFEGSVEWHTEWVKLDLEARKEIKRIGESPVKFAIAK
jgi:polynucleotide 5'-kinase involved in rRNA processing